MVRTAGVRTHGEGAEPARAGDEQSLGDLVALAAKDVSQLVRYEIDLAKTELKADARRAALSGALFGFAAFIGCLVLVLLTFALAFGLYAAGVPGGGGLYVCFVYAAVICVLIAGAMIALARVGLSRFSKMKTTRKTVTDDLDMLRRRDGASLAVTEVSTPLASDDGKLQASRVAAELPEGTSRDATLPGGRSPRR
jgi:Putative Actinobacterial Holin-X, holin superfamily III